MFIFTGVLHALKRSSVNIIPWRRVSIRFLRYNFLLFLSLLQSCLIFLFWFYLQRSKICWILQLEEAIYKNKKKNSTAWAPLCLLIEVCLFPHFPVSNNIREVGFNRFENVLYKLIYYSISNSVMRQINLNFGMALSVLEVISWWNTCNASFVYDWPISII